MRVREASLAPVGHDSIRSGRGSPASASGNVAVHGSMGWNPSVGSNGVEVLSGQPASTVVAASVASARGERMAASAPPISAANPRRRSRRRRSPEREASHGTLTDSAWGGALR